MSIVKDHYEVRDSKTDDLVAVYSSNQEAKRFKTINYCIDLYIVECLERR